MDAALAELASHGHTYYIVLLIVVGVFGGYVAGLFGIGGGVVLVPTFVTLFPYFGTSLAVLMHAAVGTCLALIVPGALMATRKQQQQGNLDLALLRSWLPAVCIGIVVGARLLPLGSRLRDDGTFAFDKGFRAFVVCRHVQSPRDDR